MLVFKEIQTAYNCYKAGLKFGALQIGGTGVRPGAKVIEGPITVTEEEVQQLNEIQKDGVNVYLQQTVQSRSTKWQDVKL